MKYKDEINIKVAIGAKHFFYRLGIKSIISVIGVEPELLQCNSFDDVERCLINVIDLNFLVINEDMIPVPKAQNINALHSLNPNCKILVITETAIANCNNCYFALNSENQKEMVEHFQEFFFEPAAPKKGEKPPILSDREIDVLKEVAHGKANKEIADKLSISTNTVITHRKNITEKLGIKTIAGLTVYAILNQLINPEDVKS